MLCVFAHGLYDSVLRVEVIGVDHKDHRRTGNRQPVQNQNAESYHHGQNDRHLGKPRAADNAHADRPEEEHQIQKKMFRAQLDIAREEKLPFMIHSREAAEDTLNIVREYMQGGMYGGIIHCFSYSREIAAEYLKMGLYLGIGGVVTFKNAKKLKETVQYAPLSQLVLETDCPYMSPEPNRGKRNSSLNLPYVAQAIAELKGITAEEVIDVTRQNAEKLLGIHQ